MLTLGLFQECLTSFKWLQRPSLVFWRLAETSDHGGLTAAAGLSGHWAKPSVNSVVMELDSDLLGDIQGRS